MTETIDLDKLSQSASCLNTASNQLTASVELIEAAIKKLNIGLEVFHVYNTEGHEIGYGKLGRWGFVIAIPQEEAEWLFGDAPRAMRIEAVDHIPAVLATLIEKANDMSDILLVKSEQARRMAESLGAKAVDS